MQLRFKIHFSEDTLYKATGMFLKAVGAQPALLCTRIYKAHFYTDTDRKTYLLVKALRAYCHFNKNVVTWIQTCYLDHNQRCLCLQLIGYTKKFT